MKDFFSLREGYAQANKFKQIIKGAKKGECKGIMKDLKKAFDAKKIDAGEYDELTAMAGRKMDQLGEEVELEEAKGKLVKNMRVKHIHNGSEGTVVKGGDKAGGRVEIEWDDGKTTVAAGKYLEPIKESVELEEGKKLRNVLSDREFEKSMKKALADKSNYKGGKVNWSFIDADVYMELTAKGYDLRHPSINYMDRFDKLADKLDPENVKESVELEEAKYDKFGERIGGRSRASSFRKKELEYELRKEKKPKNLRKEESVAEESPIQALSNLLGKKFNKNYQKAIEWMKKTGKTPADAARMFKGVDARTLADLINKD